MRLTDKESISILGLLRLKRRNLGCHNEYLDSTKTNILEHIYLLAPRPSSVTVHDISILLKLSSHFIHTWFIRRNQQSVAKKLSTETEDSLVKTISVTDENTSQNQTLKVRVLLDIYNEFNNNYISK